MLVTAAPLIDIAPLERATMPDRVVVQFDKRDVETIKLIKLDLLGLGMLAAIDETLQLIEHDCAVCLDLDRIPEEIPEVFAMLQAADTVGVFQVESRAQMQTLPEVAAGRASTTSSWRSRSSGPGPIQGNAVHPYLRRKQGLEPVTYLHPSLEPILHDTLGVILYQEQVMRIAIEVAGFTPAGSDGVPAGDGHVALEPRDGEAPRAVRRRLRAPAGHDRATTPRSCSARSPRSPASASPRATPRRSPGPPTSRPSSSCSTRPSSWSGSINAQPMGFYPVEVLVNDAKRHGVAVLPVDVNASRVQDDDRVGGPAGLGAGGAGGRRRLARRRPGRAAAGGLRDRRAARARALVGLRHPGRGVARALGRGVDDGLGRPAGAAPGQGDRRGARRRCSTRSWPAGRTGAWPTSSSGPGCPRRSSSG